MSESQVVIRRATTGDLAAVSSYGGELIRQHHAYDSQRFIGFDAIKIDLPVFYREQLVREDAAILVAELGGRIVGYAFVRLEAESFINLSDATAWIHEIYVDESARGQGVSALLMKAAINAARRLGSGSVMLSVAPGNARARKLFDRHGFRLTMHEMRLDLADKEEP
ncbi:MAG: GNAT family N-acetyltransferase [Pyrinomonadaceae bacterium]|nr:GNAT family N-acetyltransferase [Pyrinomonadaceae bacterium]